ncbi:MAG: amidohydrolase family protein, partial [Myxococcota bacterium]
DHAPDLWRDAVEVLDAAEREGAPLFAQVAGRAIGIVMSFHLTAHPFALKPSFLQIMHDGPEEKQRALRNPDLQRKLLTEEAMPLGEFETFVTTSFDKMFPMGESFDYEPAPELSVAARAEREGRAPAEVALEYLLADDSHGQLYFPLFNYSNGALDHLHVLHQHDRTLMGLSDAGAHCGAICDGGMPTFMLTHWTRDRSRGPKLPLERVIQRQTRDTARHFGLLDRGVIAPGMKADVNVIDYPRLGVGPAEVVYDLPAGGRRLLQRAHGYRATIKSGELIVDRDAPTGALPGGLLRAGRKPATS